MNRHLASAILQCGIHENDDLLCALDKCVLIITGDQNGMQDTRQDIGNGVGGICGATAVIATFGDTCSYDFIQFPDDALPISIAGLELGLHRHQDHFKDVGVLLNVLQVAVQQAQDKAQQPLIRR